MVAGWLLSRQDQQHCSNAELMRENQKDSQAHAKLKGKNYSQGAQTMLRMRQLRSVLGNNRKPHGLTKDHRHNC